MTPLIVADLVVGLVATAGGLVVLWHRPRHRVGLLLLVVAVTWFAGDLVPRLLFLHRGPIIHLHLSYPTGRLRRWSARVVVLTGYGWAVVDGWVDRPVVTAVVATGVAVAAADTFARTSGPARRAGVPALVVALCFSAVLALSAASQSRHWGADYALALGYDGVIVMVTTWLTIDLLRGRWTEDTLADLVTQLSRGSTDLQTSLRRAVGDPGLVVGRQDGETVRDAAGRTVDLAGRQVTPVLDGGVPVAVLVLDPALAEDRSLLSGAVEVTRLHVVNGLLRDEMSDQAAKLVAARDRLALVGEEQRRLLRQSIADGPVRDLKDAVRALSAAPDQERAGPLLRDIEEATTQLEDFAFGLAPANGDLGAALRELVNRFPIPVELSFADVGESASFVDTAWFVCTEALTNAAKHAGASRLAVDVRRSQGRVQIAVSDNGRGGADPSGEGLRGLAARVAARGGVLQVHSSPEAGTVVSATFPVGPDLEGGTP